jgi:orotidine-5'-phosphate decarboxylase
MTGKQTTVLRTAFNDVYHVDDKTAVTQDGTEVPTSKVEEIVTEAARNGVILHVVPAEQVEALKQSNTPTDTKGGNG